jgi:hypothetical protein
MITIHEALSKELTAFIKFPFPYIKIIHIGFRHLLLMSSKHLIKLKIQLLKMQKPIFM